MPHDADRPSPGEPQPPLSESAGGTSIEEDATIQAGEMRTIQHFFAMELVVGDNLDDFLAKRPRTMTPETPCRRRSDGKNERS